MRSRPAGLECLNLYGPLPAAPPVAAPGVVISAEEREQADRFQLYALASCMATPTTGEVGTPPHFSTPNFPRLCCPEHPKFEVHPAVIHCTQLSPSFGKLMAYVHPPHLLLHSPLFPFTSHVDNQEHAAACQVIDILVICNGGRRDYFV